MRKLLVAFTTLITTLTLTGPASAAASASSAQTVRAHALGTVPAPFVWPSQGAWVAKADATTIAWGAVHEGASASTVTDGGTVRALPAQPGCSATTAGRGHVAYDCGRFYDPRQVKASTRIVSLAGVVEGDVTAELPLFPGGAPLPRGILIGNYSLDGIGARWLHYTQRCEKYCVGTWSEDVDWRTGEAHLVKTLDPSLHEDLDARSLTVPLCAPLRSNMSAVAIEPWSVPVVFERPWALLAGPSTAHRPDDASYTVRRCGSRRPVALPSGTTPVAIGGGWALLERTEEAGPVQLLRLADHRLFSVAGTFKSYVSQAAHRQAAITAGRVVFALSTPEGVDHLYTARLPKR